MTPNFSLTLALRYQVHPWLALEVGPEGGNYLDIMDFTRPRGGVIFGGPGSLIDTDFNDFAPRIGFAWDTHREPEFRAPGQLRCLL